MLKGTTCIVGCDSSGIIYTFSDQVMHVTPEEITFFENALLDLLRHDGPNMVIREIKTIALVYLNANPDCKEYLAISAALENA